MEIELMYPTGKVTISPYLATPGFPQCDHTVGKLSADAGSLCSRIHYTYCKHKHVWAVFLNQLMNKFYFGQAKTCSFLKGQPVSDFGIAYRLLNVQKKGLLLKFT